MAGGMGSACRSKKSNNLKNLDMATSKLHKKHLISSEYPNFLRTHQHLKGRHDDLLNTPNFPSNHPPTIPPIISQLRIILHVNIKRVVRLNVSGLIDNIMVKE